MTRAARRRSTRINPWIIASALIAATSTACCKRSISLFEPPTKGAGGIEAGALTNLDVPGDSSVLAVRTTGSSKRIVVYLPPKCVDGSVSFRAWAIDAAADVSSVALQGDQACPGTPYHQLGADVSKLAARVAAALAAAGAAMAIDEKTLVLAGYSQGAARAEDLAQAHPDRFPRVLMIGSPEAPQVSHLGRARAVATMAGDRDRRDLMLVGTQALERVGVPAKFFLLPGAAHGEMGPSGGQVMREAFTWLAATAP